MRLRLLRIGLWSPICRQTGPSFHILDLRLIVGGKSWIYKWNRSIGSLHTCELMIGWEISLPGIDDNIRTAPSSWRSLRCN